jgi:argininosuccinate lyase
MAAFAEAFVDDAALARMHARLARRLPLGTAAGYGVNLPLDREGVAAELGFARVLISADVRAEQPRQARAAGPRGPRAGPARLRRFAWDLSLFTTAEFAFVRLPARAHHGLVDHAQQAQPRRGRAAARAPAVVEGAMASSSPILSLPTGYQRDLQATKGPLLRAFAAGLERPRPRCPIWCAIDLRRERMRAAISPDMFATDRAVELTAATASPSATPTARSPTSRSALDARKPEDSLRARVSLGGTAALGLDVLEARLVAAKERLAAPSEPPVRDTTP